MKKRVLLYATKFMNIYKDIIAGLQSLEYEVIWLEANTIPDNPFNKTLGLYDEINIEKYLLKADAKWRRILDSCQLSQPFEYFISIVGIDIPTFVFDELTNRNPQIHKVLYLYDRVEGVYQIDRFFKYYDDVFSFDITDCRRFNLNFLPIYWIPVADISEEETFDIFALASYSVFKRDRTTLFSKLKKLSQKRGYKEYIKLYDSSYAKSKLIFIIKNLLKTFVRQNSLTFWDVYNGLIIGSSVSPDEYRSLIKKSKVVFDTQAPYQDGLTARFMWALGAGKKIITTNTYATKYDFYNSDQIYIMHNNILDIEEFINKPYIPSMSQIDKILPYRIDNWIKTILNINSKVL